MQNTPSDLIQQAFDILLSDNQRVRITLQGTRNGGVLTIRATIAGVSGDNMLLIDAFNIGEHGALVPATSKISFDNIIEIQSITEESE
jgi:hypothetical protein